MSSRDEFKKALQGVPRAYDDFVSYLVRNVQDDADQREIMNFIAENPKASAGYVLKFFTENIWNEEDDYDEDTVFYDDEDENV